MHKCHCPTQLSGGMNNLVLRFPAHPFSGLVRKADSPPIIFRTSHLAWMASTCWVFIFTGCIVQHIVLVENLFRTNFSLLQVAMVYYSLIEGL